MINNQSIHKINYIEIQEKEINYHDISCHNHIEQFKSSLILAAMAVLSYLHLLIKGKNIISLLAAGIMIALLAITKSRLLYKIVDILIKLGNIISKFTNPILLACVYVVAVMPISLCLKFFTKDIIGLNFNFTCDSYWIIRSDSLEYSEFNKQY